ncbi:MAG TPA: DsbA family protein [Thermoanaerobaculia bacterium]|nr:DsbA family protein [Thermoanaerobaculia bacterium]
MTPEIEVTYFTDPLCSWSWAFEAIWRRLRYELQGRIAWRYALGGMIPDWKSFNDPLHSVHRPAQMGPSWYEVRHLTGMPIDEMIWVEDPPASSYPACVAVKAAGRQSTAVEEAYLRRLREAVMLERRNVARREVLTELFEELAGNPLRFRRDLVGGEALEAFREDLKDAGYRNIGRFPAFVLRGATGRAVLLVGYRPYAVFREAMAAVAPDLAPSQTAADPIAYALHWKSITAAEVAEAVGRPVDEVVRHLDGAVADGGLLREGRIYRGPVRVPA